MSFYSRIIVHSWDDHKSNPIEDLRTAYRFMKNYYLGRPVKESDSVAVFSGGMDSTVLVYYMLDQGYRPHLVSFNYGQRHNKELSFAAETAKKLDLRHDIVDLTALTHLISNSALTSDHKTAVCHELIEVPDGHYAKDTMKATVVPNRNMIMLSIAAGIAVNNSYDCVATGVHSGDHFIYPDCRPRFIKAVNAAIAIGNAGFGALREHPEGTEVQEFVYAPFQYISKAQIAEMGFSLGVPFEDTWSCYKGGAEHCGRCGTCVERLEAIAEARTLASGASDTAAVDRTVYQDSEFWKTAIKEGTN
jgi:7-cyano-7-deazaguanine synthase